MILKNCTFFNEDFEKEFGDIEIENGKIKAIGFFAKDGKDMSGKIVLPGFVDIHIHGAGGGDAIQGGGDDAAGEVVVGERAGLFDVAAHHAAHALC